MFDNGLVSFTLQPGEPRTERIRAEALRRTGDRIGGFGAAGAGLAYAEAALWSEAVPAFSIREPESFEFQLIDAEDWPATGMHTVKFRQGYRGVGVYGTLISIQLGESNDLLGMMGEFAEPPDIAAAPSISEPSARRAALGAAGFRSNRLRPRVRLNYYFDGYRWMLAYLFEDVYRSRRARQPLPEVADYVVDAHTGKVEDILPRTKSASPAPGAAAEMEEADDGLGRPRQFGTSAGNGGAVMDDPSLRVRTCDFGFRDIISRRSHLPGTPIGNPPVWEGAAVSAHANVSRVAGVLREVLGRDSWDNQGAYLISSLNCLYSGQSSGKNWKNAYWQPQLKQMLFGQRTVDGKLRSYAVALDIVAHEVFHAVVDTTARLEYLGMPGALNESLSDIFGVIVNNLGTADPRRWDWQIAEELDDSGAPMRDLADPAAHGLPAHMRDYQDLPLEQDFGGIHTNSSIHSHAFFRFATALGADGQPLFAGTELAQLVYQAMAVHLSRTSTFSGSRGALLLTAGVLFRQAPDGQEKVAAIGRAFEDVGIGP